jgi:hypothetical protein
MRDKSGTLFDFDTEVEVQMTRRVGEAKELSGNNSAKGGYERR